MDLFADHEELSRAAAERLARTAERAVAERGRFLLCLCGGSTPPRTYQLLAERRDLPWADTHIFFGDERWVGESGNHYESVRELFPRATFHPYPLGAEDAESAAARYEEHLREFFEGELPRFDVAVQGLGDDGHTASLFPGTAALGEQERWVVAHFVPGKQKWRLTLTYPVLGAARELLFLVSGAAKQAALRAVFRGDDLPATPLVRLGHARVYADRAATT